MDSNYTEKRELYEYLTSMKSLSYSIISYEIFYGIKQAAFFFKLSALLIANEYFRIVPSVFYGYYISKAMLDTSSNINEKKKWVILSISIFDFLILCVITDVLTQKNLVDVIYLLIFNSFVSYLGFWLNHVFVEKVKEKQNEKREKQNLADAKQILAEVKQNISDSKQELHSVNQEITESETKLTEVSSLIGAKNQDLEKINQEIADRTCPYCNAIFSNKKGRDTHKGKCPQKPTL